MLKYGYKVLCSGLNFMIYLILRKLMCFCFIQKVMLKYGMIFYCMNIKLI